MEKIKVVAAEFWEVTVDFWEATRVMAKANPKKATALVVAALVVGFILGRVTG